jgi:FKBP-type peptidyl-prolyl cis-trans isomerase 2|tara:strand:+ start:1329 stop:2117 length:789 start_codon:yes stop_codon:yes gene_type:complete
MPLKDGDIVTLDYEGRTDGILFDTTLEKVAKKEDALVENRKYAPITVIVGEGRLVPGFENDLKKAKIGKVTEIKIAPEEAYGPRDTKLIETMSVSKFRRTCPEAKGFVGEELNIEGRPAILANVYGSRVRIDFNPGLAGKELVFKYTVKSIVKKPVDVIRALFTMEYPADDEFDVKIEKGVAQIKLPERTKFDVNWFQAKYRVVAAIRKNTDVTDIEFLEHYEGSKPEEKTETKKKTTKANKTKPKAKKTTKAKKAKPKAKK